MATANLVMHAASAGWLAVCEILSEFIAHEHIERPLISAKGTLIQYIVSRLGKI